MSLSNVNNTQPPPLPLAANNTVTGPADSSGGSPPVIGTQQAKPKAGEIKNEWEQSVAKLNQEIKELRDATQDLLKDIRSLIAIFKMEAQLKPIVDSVDSGLQHLTDAFGSTDKLLTNLRKVNTKDWRDDKAAQEFHTTMDRYSSRVNAIMQGYIPPKNTLNSNPQLEVPQTLEDTPTPVPPMPEEPEESEESKETKEPKKPKKPKSNNEDSDVVNTSKSNNDEDSDVDNTSKSNIDHSSNENSTDSDSTDLT